MKAYLKEDLAKRFVNIIISVGNLTQKKYGGKAMYMNDTEAQGDLLTPEEILKEIKVLTPFVDSVEGRDGDYLRGILNAYQLHAKILDGATPPYKEAIKTLLQVELTPMCEKEYNQLLAKIHSDLVERGYTGTPQEQIQNWLNDTKIPPEKVIDVTKALLVKTKAATLRRVIRLPENDKIENVMSVQNVYWSGSSAYLGNGKGELTFNIDRSWSIPTFTSIVCHEGYPGHQAVYCNWNHLFLNHQFPIEGAFYSVVGDPTTPMAEGIPEMGISILGWDNFDEETPEITNEEKKLNALGNHVLRIKRMVQQEGCYRYHVLGQSGEEVARWMQSTGLLNKMDAENTVTFFSDPVQQYYYPAYHYGTILIEKAYRAIPKEKRKIFFEKIYNLPHTTETISAVVEELTNRPFNPF